MECADTDVCLQRIVTLLEQKNSSLTVHLVLNSTFQILSFFLLFIIVIHLFCFVTSPRYRAWFVCAQNVAALIEEEGEE